MAKEMNNKLRAQCEELIYKVFDALDPSKTNSEHYKAIFASMSNAQFKKYISQKFPYRFHVRPFEIEPGIAEAKKALDILNVPMLEKINIPFLYEDADGNVATSKECLVGYMHLKKVQQFVTKKNAMSVDISDRDMKTGLLLSHDKNGKESDREFESLFVNDLNATAKEFATIRADSMNAKNVAYNNINTMGNLQMSDIDIDYDDSLSRNMMNVYLLGSSIYSDVINQDYYLPYTLKNRKKEVHRENANILNESNNRDQDDIVKKLNKYNYNQIYLTSDWHLFKELRKNGDIDSARQNKYIKETIKTMNDNRVLIYLGDVSHRDLEEEMYDEIKSLVNKIHGYKILVKGNHDMQDDSFYINMGFDKVIDDFVWKDMYFTHAPVPNIQFPNGTTLNIHGHIHGEKTYINMNPGGHIDVYPKLYNNKPISLDKLLKEYKSGKYKATSKEDENFPYYGIDDSTVNLEEVVHNTGDFDIDIDYYNESYYSEFSKFINGLSSKDRYFLALDYKKDKLVNSMKNENNIFVIKDFRTDNIIGFVTLEQYEDGILIDELAISKEYRGKGIGSAVVDHISESYQCNYLKTKKDNTIMMNMLKNKNYSYEDKGSYFLWKSK